MANKKKEETKDEIIDKERIKKELVEYIDQEIEKKFDEGFDSNIRKEFYYEIDKSNRRLIREKNKNILFKNMIIIILLGIICFLVFLLYQDHYFDQFFGGKREQIKVEDNSKVEEKNKVEESNSLEEEKKEEETKPSLEELINLYGSYIDSYVLSNESSYLEKFYKEGLDDEIKSYLALNTLDFTKLEEEDGVNSFSSKDLLDKCNELFVDGCKNVSFDYNGNKIHYFSKLDTYLSNTLLKKSNTSIKREIIDITVDGNTIMISTIEGLIGEDGIYSIVPYELINPLKDTSFKEQSDKLNKLVYVFENKKLKEIKIV